MDGAALEVIVEKISTIFRLRRTDGNVQAKHLSTIWYVPTKNQLPKNEPVVV
jgi:hypothetical protein